MVAPLIMAGVGAGIGALGHLFSGKPKAPVTTTGLDPASQAYVNQTRGMSQFWANRPMPGMDPSFLAAMQGMHGYADAGQQGVDAMTDPTAAMKFMNPFMANMNPFFDQMRGNSLNQLHQSATAQGAFGSNRLGLAEGQALNDVNNSQAQFQYGGFNDAMSRAMELAHMGMGANTWLGQQGQYLTDRQRNWDIGSQGLLNGGLGPTGTVTTGPTPQKGSLGQSMLGGAMAGLSFGKSPTAAFGGAVGPAYNPSTDPSAYWNNFLGR